MDKDTVALIKEGYNILEKEFKSKKQILTSRLSAGLLFLKKMKNGWTERGIYPLTHLGKKLFMQPTLFNDIFKQKMNLMHGNWKPYWLCLEGTRDTMHFRS
jgi:hypothetical protein